MHAEDTAAGLKIGVLHRVATFSPSTPKAFSPASRGILSILPKSRDLFHPFHAMDRGRKILILVTAGGALLLLSHAAAWQLGRRSHTPAAGQSEIPPTRTSDPVPGPGDLVRLGREHEAAAREQRELEELPWPDQVAAARTKLPADADFPALVREGMAAAKVSRDYASAETVAAFGKWLGLDPDAALEFIGKANLGQSTDSFRFEIGDWLGRGNESRFDDLVERFPQAAWPLRQGAQALCRDRGADFALEMAASLKEPSKRLWLLYDCFDVKQWQGHLARVPALLVDPGAVRHFLSSISGDEDVAILLDEIRASGFPPGDVAQVEKRIADRAEEARDRERDEERDRNEREKSASALERQLGLPEFSPFAGDTPSSEQQLEKLAPGFTDALADLRDGRQSMEDVLARVQRSWPPAADPAVQEDLRRMIFDAAFTGDPLGTLQAARKAGWDCNPSAVSGLDQLSPEMALRVLTTHPDILQDEEHSIFSLYFGQFDSWQETDPETCRQALLAVPDEVLRTQFLERFDQQEQMMGPRPGGGR